MHQVLQTKYEFNTIGLKPDRHQSDIVLRMALDDTLKLFGESNKRMLLYAFGVEDTDKIANALDADGYLEFEKIAQNMKSILGNKAAEIILERVMIKMDEFCSANNYSV